MKEYEGFVKMTKKEYQAKEADARYFGDGKRDELDFLMPFMIGDLCHYNGVLYVSMVDDNFKSPVDSSWKQVFIEN